MITIIGKRWFEKTNGNTYHSVSVYIDANRVAHVPFAYGYGDMYIQTAHEALQACGVLRKEEDYGHLLEMLREKKALATVVDVARKKDL